MRRTQLISGPNSSLSHTNAVLIVVAVVVVIVVECVCVCNKQWNPLFPFCFKPIRSLFLLLLVSNVCNNNNNNNNNMGLNKVHWKKHAQFFTQP